MGETKNQPFQASFNKFLRVDFQGQNEPGFPPIAATAM